MVKVADLVILKRFLHLFPTTACVDQRVVATAAPVLLTLPEGRLATPVELLALTRFVLLEMTPRERGSFFDVLFF